MKYIYFGNELYHSGVKGMRWGVRHYQNEDGSYKSGAEGRYDPNGGKKLSKFKQFKNRLTKQYKDDTSEMEARLGRYALQKEQANAYRKSHKENQKLENSKDRSRLVKHPNIHYKGENLKAANREEADLEETRRMLKEYTNKYGKFKASKVLVNRKGVKEGLKAIKEYERSHL